MILFHILIIYFTTITIPIMKTLINLAHRIGWWRDFAVCVRENKSIRRKSTWSSRCRVLHTTP